MLETHRKPGRTPRGPSLPSALLLVAGLLACGDIHLAGGTSEVGNPSSALHGDREEDDTSSAPVTGFGISSQGIPIRVIRGKPSGDKDSSREQAFPDTSPTP